MKILESNNNEIKILENSNIFNVNNKYGESKNNLDKTLSFMENNEKYPMYMMCDSNCEISEWKLNDYKLRLSYKNPDEYDRKYFNIKEEKTFYEIIFEFSSENKDNHTIDIELDFFNKYFRLNNHYSYTINSLKFTRKKDYNDFRKKLNLLNVEVKKLFNKHFKNKAGYYYNEYIRQINEDIKNKLCKGKYLKTFEI
jgi:hypothetical protein